MSVLGGQINNILGSMCMLSHYRAIVDVCQLKLAVGWGIPLHAHIATLNPITWARCNPDEDSAMHNHISLRSYSRNHYTYNNVLYIIKIL